MDRWAYDGGGYSVTSVGVGWPTYDDLINQITVNGKLYPATHYKYIGAVSTILGIHFGAWTLTGTPGIGVTAAAGSGTPGAGGTAHTNESGSTNFPNQSPATKHLLTLASTAMNTVGSALNGTLTIYDRLVSVSGINMGAVATTNINNVALPRYTSGLDVEAWIEITTAVSPSTPSVELLSYTNELGTAGRSGNAVVFSTTSPPVGTLMPLALASGDQGIRTVETVRVTVSGGSGAANLVLLRRLACIPFITNQINEFDFVTQYPWMPRIFDGASLGYMFHNGNSNASQGDLVGLMRVGYGG